MFAAKKESFDLNGPMDVIESKTAHASTQKKIYPSTKSGDKEKQEFSLCARMIKASNDD